MTFRSRNTLKKRAAFHFEAQTRFRGMAFTARNTSRRAFKRVSHDISKPKRASKARGMGFRARNACWKARGMAAPARNAYRPAFKSAQHGISRPKRACKSARHGISSKKRAFKIASRGLSSWRCAFLNRFSCQFLPEMARDRVSKRASRSDLYYTTTQTTIIFRAPEEGLWMTTLH